MPHTSTIDHEHHRTLKTFTGNITVNDVEECIGATVSEHATGYGHFLDASHGRAKFSSAEVRKLAAVLCQAAKRTRFGPMVAVAADPVTFGLFRMFSAWASTACDVHVFRTADAASEYLDEATGCVSKQH